MAAGAAPKPELTDEKQGPAQSKLPSWRHCQFDSDEWHRQCEEFRRFIAGRKCPYTELTLPPHWVDHPVASIQDTKLRANYQYYAAELRMRAYEATLSFKPISEYTAKEIFGLHAACIGTGSYRYAMSYADTLRPLYTLRDKARIKS
jgi:hypothetical protein